MSDVAPSTAVVAAGNVPAFVLADVDVAEILAALAPFTTPSRFQMLLFDLASCPDELERLKRKHASLGTICPSHFRASSRPRVSAGQGGEGPEGDKPHTWTVSRLTARLGLPPEQCRSRSSSASSPSRSGTSK